MSKTTALAYHAGTCMRRYFGWRLVRQDSGGLRRFDPGATKAMIKPTIVSDDDVAKRRTLTASHRRRLEWFQDHAEQTVTFPPPVPGVGLLVTRAKGIYKPADLDYALSVRVMLSSPYADKAVERHGDGTWSLAYFQENTDPAAVTAEYTNRGLLRCRDDRVPVGVLVQVSKKPIRYKVLGLALVASWSSGFFQLESTRI